MSTTLVITGMHRSGTSMVANYLQLCGINIAENLHPGDVGNPRGYYEDVDILRFHQDLLAYFKAGTFPTSDAQISRQVPAEFTLRAQEIVRRKADSPVWGWKDCRTSLFLPFWQALMPEINFLFLLRHPVSVVDSLLRRGTDPALLRYPVIAFRSWRLHNQRILSYYQRNTTSCFLVDIDSFVSNGAAAASALFSKLSIALPVRAFDTVYAPEAFKVTKSPRDVHLMLRYPLQTIRCLRLFRAMKGLVDWPRPDGALAQLAH
jgi:hypothetical protein